MNYEKLEAALSELPLYIYAWIEPKNLEFSDRVRWICQHECAMYGTTWACPPGVGTVEECKAKCLGYNKCLLISTITEVADIGDLQATLATRCAILDNKPCRHPEKMHPCVESQGINIIPTLEENGLEFQYGSNVVTWVSLLLFTDGN